MTVPTSLATRMRSQSPTRLSLAAVALVLVTAGCGEEEDVSPSFEDRIPLRVELEAGKREVRFGDQVELSGALTQGGKPLADQEVRLEADPYPFDESWGALLTTTTDDAGRFAFEAEPEFNTTYRAVAGESSEALSPTRAVYVNPVNSVNAEPVAGARTRFVTSFRHSTRRSLDGAAVFSYGGPVLQAQVAGSVPFVALERVKQLKPGRSRAVIELPGLPGDLAYEICVSYAPSNAVGVPRADCGRGERPFAAQRP